jgi:hypothetical protein
MIFIEAHSDDLELQCSNILHSLGYSIDRLDKMLIGTDCARHLRAMYMI